MSESIKCIDIDSENVDIAAAYSHVTNAAHSRVGRFLPGDTGVFAARDAARLALAVCGIHARGRSRVSGIEKAATIAEAALSLVVVAVQIARLDREDAHGAKGGGTSESVKHVLVHYGTDEKTETYGGGCPAGLTDDEVALWVKEQMEAKAKAGEIRPGRVRSVHVLDA